MKTLLAITMAVVALVGAPAQQRDCDRLSIPPRSYQAFGERLAVYVGDIDLRIPAFSVRALVGTYRRPFLASTGVLTEPGLDKLLASRPDISQHRLDWNPREKNVLSVTVDGRPVTVRVIKHSAADVVVEVCGLR
jgi:hypothetical protein